MNILAKPSFAKCLKFPIWGPIKEMLHFQTLPLHVSQSPQYRIPPSRFPSQSLYKERNATFPKPSLTCFTWPSEFPVKEPSLQVPSQSCHIYIYIHIHIHEGKSISKLQIVIGKKRMEMTYKQHLFFNVISIQI
jgi:hypothetical protein